jgi:hypothetical protein
MTIASTNYDVIICGGGPSGFVAAIAAGRSGARTLLIEKYGFVGGMATSAWLGPISPMHFGDERVIAGIPEEFVERMRVAGGSTGHLRCTNPHGSGAYLGFYDREHYKWTAVQMLQEAGVDILFRSFIADVVVENGAVTGVEVASKSGKRVYFASVVVDATGDGDIAALAGAEHTVGNDHGVSQPSTLMFDMANVDTGRLKAYMDENLDNFEWASEMVALKPFSERLQQQHFVGQGFLDLVAQGLASEDLYFRQLHTPGHTPVHGGKGSFACVAQVQSRAQMCVAVHVSMRATAFSNMVTVLRSEWPEIDGGSRQCSRVEHAWDVHGHRVDGQQDLFFVWLEHGEARRVHCAQQHGDRRTSVVRTHF